MDAQIKSAASYLADQAGRLIYGEVSIKLIIHNGKISRLERQVVEKIQTDAD